MVTVDGRVHQRAGHEEALRGLNVPFREDEASVHEPERTEQAAVIDRPVGNAGMVGVTDEVVHPVHV